MWNRDLYVRELEAIKKCGVFNGKQVKSKEKIYDELVMMLGYEKDTLKSWARINSNGPYYEEDRVKLEEILGLQKGALYIVEQRKGGNGKMRTDVKISEVTRQAILSCYISMREYLRSDEVESEERFIEMEYEVQKLKIAIPQFVFGEIEGFIDKELAPIIYDKKTVFASCYTDDIGTFDDDGRFRTTSEEGTYKRMTRFTETLFNIEKKLEEFGENNLRQYVAM